VQRQQSDRDGARQQAASGTDEERLPGSGAASGTSATAVSGAASGASATAAPGTSATAAPGAAPGTSTASAAGACAGDR